MDQLSQFNQQSSIGQINEFYQLEINNQSFTSQLTVATIDNRQHNYLPNNRFSNSNLMNSNYAINDLNAFRQKFKQMDMLLIKSNEELDSLNTKLKLRQGYIQLLQQELSKQRNQKCNVQQINQQHIFYIEKSQIYIKSLQQKLSKLKKQKHNVQQINQQQRFLINKMKRQNQSSTCELDEKKADTFKYKYKNRSKDSAIDLRELNRSQTELYKSLYQIQKSQNYSSNKKTQTQKTYQKVLAVPYEKLGIQKITYQSQINQNQKSKMDRIQSTQINNKCSKNMQEVRSKSLINSIKPATTPIKPAINQDKSYLEQYIRKKYQKQKEEQQYEKFKKFCDLHKRFNTHF